MTRLNGYLTDIKRFYPLNGYPLVHVFLCEVTYLKTIALRTRKSHCLQRHDLSDYSKTFFPFESEDAVKKCVKLTEPPL